MFGIFGGAQQILIVVATLLVIFSLLGCAMCYWRCRGEHSSYVLNPAMTMPINKPPEREFYVAENQLHGTDVYGAHERKFECELRPDN